MLQCIKINMNFDKEDYLIRLFYGLVSNYYLEKFTEH